ncbi:hypothetical protein [Leptolyngbya sp. FACHB-711]|uniref:hypothetical protein n=1 Tax=unclassified Leptolyngbya TaxID=2650499 RepID=UPI001684C211|nr:hypothetical protein [Leptolyngbya sp. FACHB-711]MBD1852194.1 hypothetical protein [Cyanobacteria bacterium FACHB-502]MBD2027356.1 hypothetical protein [Leptolyngbya sp. FACHB-711]
MKSDPPKRLREAIAPDRLENVGSHPSRHQSFSLVAILLFGRGDAVAPAGDRDRSKSSTVRRYKYLCSLKI